MRSPRSSIIVVPTKALAYNKHIWAESNLGENSSMYVGSAIGNIKTDITINDVKKYIAINDGKHKKFLVVADSLYKVIETLGGSVFNEYFLMVDEIDTLQSDSTYRPALERVIDYYLKFDRTKRSLVSATMRNFSDERLNQETVVTTNWDVNPQRNINLIHTNNVDAVAVEKINEILNSESEETILVAYNSLDGILNIINLLDRKSECGVLCSEYNKEKVEEYTSGVIDEHGNLQKRIVFMTCAYFAGIDINNKCHLISISTNNQPFTLLSPNKLTQIAGRCRNGLHSEVVIFDTKNQKAVEDYEMFKRGLLERAKFESEGLNSMKKAAINNPALHSVVDNIESTFEVISVEKVAGNYSISIIRKNIDGEIVPAFFNIDALLEQYEIHYQFYNNKEALQQELKEQGHVINQVDKYITFREEQRQSIVEIKEKGKERLAQALQDAKQTILDWIAGGSNKKEFHQLLKNSNKQVKEFYERFQKLSPYIAAEPLIELLIENHDTRKFRNLNNAIIFWALEDGHILKLDVLNKFKYAEIEQQRINRRKKPGITITIGEKKKLLKEVTETHFKGIKMNDDSIVEFLPCFFKVTRSDQNDKIIGLNPRDLPEPISRIGNNADLKKLFIFPYN